MHVFLGYRPGKIPAERDRRQIYFQYHATLEILWGRCRPAQGIFSHAKRSSKQTNAGICKKFFQDPPIRRAKTETIGVTQTKGAALSTASTNVNHSELGRQF